MKKKAYEKLIITACESVGTMQPAFKSAVSVLAEIMEQREAVYKLYVAEGAQPIITKTLDRGNKNPAKNPLLTTWQDLNDQALTYMNSLGLTAKGLKQIKDSQGIERQTSFEDFVNMIERETAEAESKGNNKNDN